MKIWIKKLADDIKTQKILSDWPTKKAPQHREVQLSLNSLDKNVRKLEQALHSRPWEMGILW